MDYSKKTLQKFSTELGSPRPHPGGGSAAAVVGALGASLVEMVMGINEKKRGGASAAHRRTRRIRVLKERFLRLVSEDVRVFLVISRFFGNTRDPRKYQAALKKGAAVPLEMCRLSVEAMRLALPEKKRTGRWLLSDLKEAVVLLEAAFRSAKLNVEINLAASKDRSFVSKTRRSLQAMERELKGLKHV